MVTIELKPDEVEMLRPILENYLSDLRMEIADTEQMDFREDLKQVEAFLKKLLGQLEIERVKVPA